MLALRKQAIEAHVTKNRGDLLLPDGQQETEALNPTTFQEPIHVINHIGGLEKDSFLVNLSD